MYFEDFEEGVKLTTRERTVTETDIELFASLTGALNPLFLSKKFAQELGQKDRIAPGLLTLSLAVGLEYQLGIFDRIHALLGMNAKFPAPVYPGDRIRCEVEVKEKKEKRDDRGLVKLKSWCKNQDGTIVMEVEKTLLVRKK